ncbi:MAG: hypothetical protein J1E36_06480 [Eubacterium sp.]|nr:hypothetical protein [Eubacterium sp.]
MKKELDYFKVEGDYGFNQDKFTNLMMKMGGCAAVTACDSLIYFKKYKGIESLYPYDTNEISKKDYVDFSNIIKPYLHPRMSGVDKLDIYIDGLNDYLNDINETRIKLSGLSGDESIGTAKEFIAGQIDNGYPIPYLILKHKDPSMKDFVWHWFLITGYEILDSTTKVKVVSYGEYQWFDLDTLWNTGYSRKGGLIKFENITTG